MLPDPGGELGGLPWWATAVVERWRPEHEGPARLHYRYQGSPVISVDDRRLLTTAAAIALLDVSEQQFHRMKRRRPLIPAVIFGSSKLWLLEDVKAYRDGHAIERAEGELNSLLLSVNDIAKLLGVTRTSVLRGVARGSNRYPQQDGAIGTKPWWGAGRFELWLAERLERNDPRLRS